MNWNLTHIQKLAKSGKIRGYKVLGSKKEETGRKGGKNRKMGNIPAVVDGIKFQSSGEAARYKELLLLQKSGYISGLSLQVGFELNQGGTHSLKYIADFCYCENGVYVVEDFKGFETAVFKKKKRLMKKVHNIDIRITKK